MSPRLELPSRRHPNRRVFNRTVYDLADRKIVLFEDCFRGTLIDLGCGTAAYREYFCRHVDCYIGVDWASSLHETEADVIADLNARLPFRAGSANVVSCISVLEHLKEPQAFLQECRRILADGGRLLLVVPFMWHVHEAPYDYFRYTRFGLLHLLQQAGFESVRIEEATGFWCMWIIKFNYQSRKLVRGPRPVRFLIRGVLAAIWMIDQKLGAILDSVWPGAEETQGYVVLAS